MGTERGFRTAVCFTHLASAIVHAVVGGLALSVTLRLDSLPVTRTDRGEYPYDSGVAKQTAVFRFQPVLCIAALEFVTCLFEILYARNVLYGRKLVFFFPQDFGTWTSNELRWLEYAITATLGTFANAIGVGGNDLSTVVLLGGAGVSLQACGLLAERAKAKGDPFACRVSFAVGVLLQACVSVTLFIPSFWSGGDSSHDATDVCWKPDEIRRRWQEQSAVYFAYYMSFGVNCAVYLFADGVRFQVTEFVYALLSFSSKTAIGGLVVATVRQFTEHFAPCARAHAKTLSVREWDVVRYFVMIAPGALALVWGLVGYFMFAQAGTSTSALPTGPRLLTSVEARMKSDRRRV